MRLIVYCLAVISAGLLIMFGVVFIVTQTFPKSQTAVTRNVTRLHVICNKDCECRSPDIVWEDQYTITPFITCEVKDDTGKVLKRSETTLQPDSAASSRSFKPGNTPVHREHRKGNVSPEHFSIQSTH